MKRGYLAVIACAMILGACSSEKRSGSEDEDTSSKEDVSGYVIEKVSYSDSLTVGRSNAKASCTITYLKPEGTGSALTASVDNWERKMLGMDGKTDLTGLALAKARVTEDLGSSKEDLSQWSSDDSYPPVAYEYYYDFDDVFTTPRCITMLYSMYSYLGGAHGMGGTVGQTFVVKNGAKIGLDMFKAGTEREVLEIVKKGLMEQYFQVNSEREFLDCLNFGSKGLEMPVNPPYFDEHGVVFQYQSYEIAPYSSGQPFCVIDYDVLMPYFTQSVAKLLAE